MSTKYWNLVSEIEQLIASHQNEQAIDAVEKILNEYGNLEHSLYLKGISLQQQGLSSENSDSLHLVAKGILSSKNSTVTHLDNAFRWFYLVEDWDSCCEVMDRILRQDIIPASLPPGMYFNLIGPNRRALIREQLDMEQPQALLSEHPYINELKILFQTSSSVSSRCAKGDGPVVMLITDTSIQEHFDAVRHQFVQMDYPTISIDPSNESSDFPRSQADLKSWLGDLNPLAVFIQTPYLETLPQLWQPVITSQPFCIPGYALHLAGDDFWWGISHGQFGLSGYVLAHHVFAANKPIADSFHKCGLSSSQVILTGDPLTWSMRRDSQSRDVGAYFDLLWAPHWTPTNLTGRRSAYRNVERDTELVLQYAEAGNSVCLRPHPLLTKAAEEASVFSVLDSGLLEQSFLETWKELVSHKNVTLSTATMVEDIHRCKRLLTDGISIIFYWSLTGKPIAISSRHDSPTFADFAEPLLNEIPKLFNEREILDWLANSSTKSRQILIDQCNNIIPDNKRSPIEFFLEFATAADI